MAETTTNGERPREDPEKTLWMGDLAFEWDEAFIADLFEGFGNVTAYRPYDPRADRPTLYAFVTFESEAEATRAFEELNGATIPDTRRRFRLNPRSKRPERPSERMARKRPRSRSPGGYDRRSPPGGRWRPGSRTPSRSPSAGRRWRPGRDDERARSRSFDRRDRGPGDPGRGDPARDRDEPRRERPANGRPRPDQEEGEAYVRLALWPGGRDGEVPPGVPVGKVLGDFTARFVAERRGREAESAEDTCWRRALELGGNGVVAALVDGVLVAASERVQHHHATLVPVLARSPFGFAVLRRTLAFVMQLSVSIETPRLRLAVAGLAPGGFLATVDGDDDVRVDADYCARLDASVRQLVDLDVVIERRVAPYAKAAATLRGASLKALKAAHEPAADCHFAEVRLGEADRDVHGFHAARRAGAPLAASSKKLDGFDFALKPCGDGRTLLVELARPRPRGGPGADATPLCCGLSAGAEGEAEGAASLAARGSWTSSGADDGAANGATTPPATLLAAGDRAAVHGLDCAGTLNALARAHGDRVLRDRVALAQASLDAAASDVAAGVAKAREPTALLVAGAVGAGAPWLAAKLATMLRGRGLKVYEMSTRDHETDDGGLDAKSLAGAVGSALARRRLGGAPQPGDAPVVVLEGPHALGPACGDALAGCLDGCRCVRALAAPGAAVAVDDLDALDGDVLRQCAFLAAAARAPRPLIGPGALAAFAGLDDRDARLVGAAAGRADVVLPTALPVDVGALKPYVAPSLKAVPPDAPEYAAARALLAALAPFDAIPRDALPHAAHVASILDAADPGK